MIELNEISTFILYIWTICFMYLLYIQTIFIYIILWCIRIFIWTIYQKFPLSIILCLFSNSIQLNYSNYFIYFDIPILYIYSDSNIYNTLHHLIVFTLSLCIKWFALINSLIYYIFCSQYHSQTITKSTLYHLIVFSLIVDSYWLISSYIVYFLFSISITHNH